MCIGSTLIFRDVCLHVVGWRFMQSVIGNY